MGRAPVSPRVSFLLGIELTAEAVEEPFGKDLDDLPLENYCRTVETFVFSVLLESQPLSAQESGGFLNVALAPPGAAGTENPNS